MPPKLKPISDPKQLAAIPLDQPVLVEIAPAPSGAVATPSTPAPSDAPPATPSDDGGVAKLQKELELLKAADKQRQEALDRAARERDEARQLADRQARELHEVRAQGEMAVSDNVQSGLAGAQAEQRAAQSAYANALANSDHVAAAEANALIARAASKILNFEAAAAELADRQQRQAQRPQPQQQQPQQQAPVDIVTRINTATDLTPKEKEWLLSHQEVFVDDVRSSELATAYKKAMRAGITRGTDKYFQFLDKELGYDRQDDGDEQGESTIMAAPVSRDSNSAPGQRPSDNQITLTPEMREMARSLGVSDEAYARQVLRQNQEKKANPERYGFRS